MAQRISSVVHTSGNSIFFFILLQCAVLLPLQASADSKTNETAVQTLPDYVIDTFGQPPAVPTGKLDAGLREALDTTFAESLRAQAWGHEQTEALASIAESGDPRLVWPITDMMRFITNGGVNASLASAASQLLGIEFKDNRIWGTATDHLMAWRIPAYPGYLDTKKAIFTSFVPGWEKIFAEGDIDWRLVSWGGVLIDDRAYDTTDKNCNCIPAADNPEVTSTSDATWLKDDAIVFGIEVNGEYRAYPRQIMEVREMVNDTLGGRDLGIPYCTLCASAQAYFTDNMPDGVERPVLRTSGLLIRSNKVMYDINSHSVFDTFKGTAVTGPLAEQGIKLPQASVITTSWGEWKKAHPETTVLAEKLALGRDFDFRNNRDADGPIFPIGDVDPRLPVHEDIVGVVTATGQAIAFQRSKVVAALTRDEAVIVDGIQLVLDGGGIKAIDEDGADLGSHQAFWFAWSQFYPGTELWVSGG